MTHHPLPLSHLVEEASLGLSTKSSKDSADDLGGTPTIRVGDLPDRAMLITTASGRTDLLATSGRAVRAQRGDVLLVARGSGLKVGVVGEATEGAVIGGNLLLLRPKPGVCSGAVLACWLDSTSGRAALDRASRGTSLMSLSVKDVLRIELPTPPPELQKMIERLFVETSIAYSAGREAAELRRDLALAVATNTIIHGDL